MAVDLLVFQHLSIVLALDLRKDLNFCLLLYFQLVDLVATVFIDLKE